LELKTKVGALSLKDSDILVQELRFMGFDEGRDAKKTTLVSQLTVEE
jgi:hypothetical protein